MNLDSNDILSPTNVNTQTFASRPGLAGRLIDRARHGGIGDRFEASLDRARSTFNDASINSVEDAVRKGASELVAAAFFEPLFAMMREDPLRSELIPTSAGEKTFGPMLDAELSRRITERGNFPITEALVRQLLEHYRPTDDAQGLRADTQRPEDHQEMTREALNVHA